LIELIPFFLKIKPNLKITAKLYLAKEQP
jgi:hypothetical protein